MSFLAKLSWGWSVPPVLEPAPNQGLPMPKDERFALPMSPSSLRLPAFAASQGHPAGAQEP